MGSTEVLARDQITVDPSINPRKRLDHHTIETYVESWPEVPPVVVYDLSDEPGTMLLADGFHRMAAADERHEKQIPVEVRKGDRHKAIIYAAGANMRHGRPLTPEERAEAVRRALEIHPGSTNVHLAKLLGIPDKSIQRVRKAAEVREVTAEVANGTELTMSTYEAISPAPKKHWAKLVETTVEEGWTYLEVRAAVSTLRSRNTSDEEKQRVLGGGTPFEQRNGESRVLAETLERKMADAHDDDDIGPMWAALEAVAVLETRLNEADFSGLSAEQVQRAVDQLEHAHTTIERTTEKVREQLGVRAA